MPGQAAGRRNVLSGRQNYLTLTRHSAIRIIRRAAVAQLVEQWTENPCVISSILIGGRMPESPSTMTGSPVLTLLNLLNTIEGGAWQGRVRGWLATLDPRTRPCHPPPYVASQKLWRGSTNDDHHGWRALLSRRGLRGTPPYVVFQGLGGVQPTMTITVGGRSLGSGAGRPGGRRATRSGPAASRCRTCPRRSRTASRRTGGPVPCPRCRLP